MPVRTTHSDDPSLYFITFTCFNWLPLFQLTNSYDLVYKWFGFLKEQKNISTTAFVIMPNHLHCILFFPAKGYSLNTIIGNAKRFMAYEIVQRLRNMGRQDILVKMSEELTLNERKKGQLHKVFENSFDAKSIETEKFLQQKLQYIHMNPVRGNYTLTDDWRSYEHSSAGFYELNKSFHFTPVHYMELQ